MPKKLVFNMLVAKQQIDKGYLQSELFDYVRSLGFNKIEIRREYFHDIHHELKAIHKLSHEKNIEIFYSVPDVIFDAEGRVNPELPKYIEEAKQMNATYIKLTIGHYQSTSNLKVLQFINQESLNVTVENDQTEKSGKIDALLNFLSDCVEHDVHIGYTFDLGNFAYVGENEIVALEQLSQFISYIHLKNVKHINKQLVAVSLDEGMIDWKKAMSLLPLHVPIALEYPSSNSDEILHDKQSIEVI